MKKTCRRCDEMLEVKFHAKASSCEILGAAFKTKCNKCGCINIMEKEAKETKKELNEVFKKKPNYFG